MTHQFIIFQNTGAIKYITLQRNTANGGTSDTHKPMFIFNWLGFLGGETSTSVIDCASLGQITLEIVIAPAICCFISSPTYASTITGLTPHDGIFLPNSRALLPTFRANCPDGSHFAQMGSDFAQKTTTNPCSLLSRH